MDLLWFLSRSSKTKQCGSMQIRILVGLCRHKKINLYIKYITAGNDGRFASGAGFVFPTRIRIQESYINADPDPQHWLLAPKAFIMLNYPYFNVNKPGKVWSGKRFQLDPDLDTQHWEKRNLRKVKALLYCTLLISKLYQTGSGFNKIPGSSSGWSESRSKTLVLRLFRYRNIQIER